MNNSNPASYIVAPTINNNVINLVANGNIESSSTNALSDVKLICFRKKKKSKRHIQVTFIETRPLSSPNEQPCIELVNKSKGSSQSATSYLLAECHAFEYFDTVKNDFQSFIYAYFESFTISIFFSDDLLEKKSLVIKFLETLNRSKTEATQDINGIVNPNLNNNMNSDQSQMNIQPASQQSILPCPSTTEHILHTFDIQLIAFGTIIPRDHALIGPARLYFTTTDLYLASIDCKRADLKVTITNQCPLKDKVILCIPYFTIKNYGNRSNIFLIELGKSNYGNGEIRMKCKSSSLASTIHLLVSPVIEERPLILSSAFQNQLLTHKRIEKSKNIQPPIQLNNDSTNVTVQENSVSFLNQKSVEPVQNESRSGTTRSNDFKSRLVVGFFRSLTKNVAHLRRSATFHHSSACNNTNQNKSSLDSSLPLNTNLIGVKIDEKILCNDQHKIILPESQKKVESTVNAQNVVMPQNPSETNFTPTMFSAATVLDTNGTYIDMGPTQQKLNEDQQEICKDETMVQEPTSTVEIGVNTIISLSPHVRSAIIVGNSVHLIADEKTFFPIGQRSFTSPASVMQPFKTQLSGQSSTNPYIPSSNTINSSPNSSNSLHQPNSVSNSQQSLLLSYGIVTFNNNMNSESTTNEQNERAISPPTDGSAVEHRLNSDLSLISNGQQTTQTPTNCFSTLENGVSSSNSHIFRALSVSTISTGENTGPFRTSNGSIILFDDHLIDQTATYLLGPPVSISDEPTNSTIPRISSFTLTTSISRPHLSHIDEERSSSVDPYALVEPLVENNSVGFTNNLSTGMTLKSVDYTDILPVDHSEHGDYSPLASNQDDQHDETNEFVSDETEDSQSNGIGQRPSTILYSNIDFHQTHRRDRLAQFVTKTKVDDQTPPFVL